jgi:XapX domain-containing protein
MANILSLRVNGETMLKLAIGLVLAVCIGIGCRWFGIPLPGPPAIMGAAMAVAMASGYTATDYILTRRRAATTAVANSSTQPVDSSKAPALNK